MYEVTKTWGHERGLSSTFRQWRANSHCARLHGYALSISITFEAHTLDDRNWVIDFGDLEWIKRHLTFMFDHTTLVAMEDPERGTFEALRDGSLIALRWVDATGCEAFAKLVYDFVQTQLPAAFVADNRGLRVKSVTVAEHGANSATFRP